MKKVARLRIPQPDLTVDPPVRTTGRIKKPKAVFDPSDNYLPRAARLSSAAAESKSAASSTASPSLNATTAAGGGSGSPVEQQRRKESVVAVATHQQQKPSPTQRLSSRSSSSGSVGNTPSNASTTMTYPESITNDTCHVCLKREFKRGSGAVKNKLFACLECDKRIHKLCIKVDFENWETLRHNYKCDDCRSCEVCDAFSDFEAKIDKELVTCTKCVKSYHLTCHIPNVHKYQQLENDWKCNKCSSSAATSSSSYGIGGMMRSDGIGMLPVKTIREIMGAAEPAAKVAKVQAPPPPPLQPSVNIAAAAAEAKTVAAASKRKSQEQKTEKSAVANGNKNESEPKKPKSNDAAVTSAAAANSVSASTMMRYSPNEPIDLPDVKYWSVAQVAEFFAKYFPSEAHVFKDQEIDGMSLLLLKRSDVIKKLPIKLGPSLRIYSLILKIQTQLNDSTLGWNCGL